VVEVSAPEVQEPKTETTDAPIEGETKAEEAKPEKTPEQRELDRTRRKLDRVYRQREEARAELRLLQQQGLTRQPIARTNEPESTDSDTLTLSRAELQQQIQDEARKLAPSIQAQQAEIEHRQKVIDGLAKSWGKDKFDSYAESLADAFDGLVDRDQRPKPAVDAIFEADKPSALIEYLADPDNADEAESLSRMSAVSAGRFVAKLEAKLAEKAKAKPQPSKAAAPIEPVRGSGVASSLPSDSDSAEVWAKKERARMAALNKRA
jgi:hypothetical protein